MQFRRRGATTCGFWNHCSASHGGLNTRSESFREHFEFPITFDTEKLFGLKGGTFYIACLSHNGPNADLRLDGNGRADGTGGVYALLDQLVWKPAGKPRAEDTSGGIAMTCSLNRCDPRVNPIDANALVGVAWTGPLPKRPADILGLGHVGRGEG